MNEEMTGRDLYELVVSEKVTLVPGWLTDGTPLTPKLILELRDYLEKLEGERRRSQVDCE